LYVDVRIPYHIFLLLFHDTPTTQLYSLSLHDALPISRGTFSPTPFITRRPDTARRGMGLSSVSIGRQALFRGTNILPSAAPGWRSEAHTSESSHVAISYAVFCMKKKKKLKLRPRHLIL